MRDVAGGMFALALGLGSACANAVNSGTDPQRIRAVAEGYVAAQAAPGSELHATADRLDPRLRLAACVGELTPYLPPGASVGARTSVGVRCPDSGGWSILVPVNAESVASVLVARRALARGEVPAAGDVEAVTRRVPGLASQFATQMADLEGRRLLRPVAAGAVLPLAGLAPGRLVERGQRVTLVAAETGIAVRAAGVALEPGGHGDLIKVRNLASGRSLEGRVQADGTVALGP